MVRIVVHPDKCTGCRACELACSYHHTKVFSRQKGSITVLRNEREGMMIPHLHRVKENGYPPCDGCLDENKPLCVKYCSTRALEAV